MTNWQTRYKGTDEAFNEDKYDKLPKTTLSAD